MRALWVLALVFCVAVVGFGAWCLSRPDIALPGAVCLAIGAYGVYDLVYTALFLRRF